MDGDGELQPGDDVSTDSGGLPCTSDVTRGERCIAGANNNKDIQERPTNDGNNNGNCRTGSSGTRNSGTERHSAENCSAGSRPSSSADVTARSSGAGSYGTGSYVTVFGGGESYNADNGFRRSVAASFGGGSLNIGSSCTGSSVIGSSVVGSSSTESSTASSFGTGSSYTGSSVAASFGAGNDYTGSSVAASFGAGSSYTGSSSGAAGGVGTLLVGVGRGADKETDEEDEEEEEAGYTPGDDYDDDDSDEDRMLIDIPEDEDDDVDSTDGGSPGISSELAGSGGGEPHLGLTTHKRVPVQSQRMRDYQAMQQTASLASRPRPCPWCERVLYSGPGFRYHLSTHKTGKESFTCDACRKKFKSFNGLKYHRKRKRCKGIVTTTAPADVCQSTAVFTTTPSQAAHKSYLAPTSAVVFEEEFHAQRLMELAKIATSPQSPLLQSPGPDSRGSVGSSFFDDSEASAVIALSSMMRSSESRKSLEACSSSQIQPPQPPHPPSTSALCPPQQQQQQPQQATGPDVKSKRPMNGFMLYAQQHRAELKKKYPDINNRMISTKLSEEWNALPEEVRQRWKDEARYKAELTLKEYPDCWKRKK